MNDERRRGWSAQSPRQPARARRARPRRPPALPVHHVETPQVVATLARWSAGISRNADRLRAALAVLLAVCGLTLAHAGLLGRRDDCIAGSAMASLRRWFVSTAAATWQRTST